MLRRFSTGILGGIAGVTIGLIISLALGLKTLPPDRAITACEFGGLIGFLLGLVFGKPSDPDAPSR
jgi:hypothetical protein